ncbi:hypothetical protein [Bacillus toyonensis]|uniref:hypothetical protein n=1 Tax=Bacillus toyonensis TaxID=155322 RepID=UPI000BF4B524|nr:hypothetical protein [Bacillus toyonensis]PGF05314.1 hypothetical protein COM61_02570 [Bacillus toyonensis]
MDMQRYHEIVSRTVPTQTEMEIHRQVRVGLEHDEQSSPWSNDKYYRGFDERNSDGYNLKQARINKLLMVVSDSTGTFYNNGRRTGISRGSVIIKLSEDLIYCVDAFYWGATPYGPVVTALQGYLQYTYKTSTYGKVKELASVRP